MKARSGGFFEFQGRRFAPSGYPVLRHGNGIEAGRKESAFAQKLQCHLAVFRLDNPTHSRAVSLDGLVAESAHSNKSPEETRRISSSEVTPAAALCKASWCMVSMVF